MISSFNHVRKVDQNSYSFFELSNSYFTKPLDNVLRIINGFIKVFKMLLGHFKN
jgi:hypothetical protein